MLCGVLQVRVTLLLPLVLPVSERPSLLLMVKVPVSCLSVVTSIEETETPCSCNLKQMTPQRLSNSNDGSAVRDSAYMGNSVREPSVVRWSRGSTKRPALSPAEAG